jgi:phosphatidylserine/phosphatidylglycerophosphate/cardiolipin synthase-like enzyme
MGGLPLQPDPQPWPPWQRRLALILALALAVLVLGLAVPSRGAPPRLVFSGPGNELDWAREAQRLIAGARQRVWMAMYVVRIEEDGDGPVSGLLATLAAAAARGVDVRVCLDQGAGWDGRADDKHLAPAAWLSARGVRCVLDEPDRTSHAKLLVIDGRHLLVGSHNWTRAAMTANREASVVLDDPVLAAEAEGWLAEIPGW